MSYSIWVKCEHCGLASEDSWSYTSNCAPMWREAGVDLSEFDGQPASVCANLLADALTELRRDPDKYRAMNPPNAWGSYDTLVTALESLLRLLRQYPKTVVRVSC